jgi:DNA-binding transcriptional MerR regulator
MRKQLTISEVSKLLNISTYNIRYYEKEGLISPSGATEAGYRLYDYDSMFALNAVILLRDCGMPIKEIEALMADYSNNKFLKAVENAYSEISGEIKKLQETRASLENILNASILDKTKNFVIRQKEKRIFIPLKVSDYNMDYSIKEVYDAYRKNDIDTVTLYKEAIYYILRDETIALCTPADSEEENSITLPPGDYLTYHFLNDSDDKIPEHIEIFYEYMVDHDLSPHGELLLIYESNIPVTDLSQAGYPVALQIRVTSF